MNAQQNPTTQAPQSDAPTLAMFKDWLLEGQTLARQRMSVTTGDTFSFHCDEFIQFTSGLDALYLFEKKARG